jgi:capsid protein
MRYRSRPGGKLVGFSPNVPNPEFFEHSMLILTFISINLGLPVQLLLLDPKQTNFSGWRGAMDQARLGFRKLQRWLARSFHSRVYRWKVRQWMSEDRRWNPPRWPYIEPMKDAAAGILRVRNLQTSPRRLASENGYEWPEITRETRQDNGSVIRMMKEEAAKINKEFPDDPDRVSWREVLCLPTPDRVGAQVTPTESAQQSVDQGATDE